MDPRQSIPSLDETQRVGCSTGGVAHLRKDRDRLFLVRLGCLGGKSQRAQRRHVGCEARPNEESVHRRIPFFCLGSFPPMETLTRRECVRNAPTALLLTRRCEQAGADPCAGMRDTLTIIIESRYEQKRPDHAGMPTAAFKKGTPPCRKRELSPKFRAPRHLRSSRRVSMWVDASVSRLKFPGRKNH